MGVYAMLAAGSVTESLPVITILGHVTITVSCLRSETDSDGESFYGSIERPMDINHSEDLTEDGKA